MECNGKCPVPRQNYDPPANQADRIVVGFALAASEIVDQDGPRERNAVGLRRLRLSYKCVQYTAMRFRELCGAPVRDRTARAAIHVRLEQPGVALDRTREYEAATDVVAVFQWNCVTLSSSRGDRARV
jgi:hypothetical protein